MLFCGYSIHSSHCIETCATVGSVPLHPQSIWHKVGKLNILYIHHLFTRQCNWDLGEKPDIIKCQLYVHLEKYLSH